MHRRRTIPLILHGLALATATPCLAGETDSPGPLSLEAEYVHDVSGVVHGPATGVRRADYISLSGELSLEDVAGWKGARAFAQVIAATGQRPNDLAGTLQGVNNIEVPNNRVRLFQAWIEQDIPAIRGSLRIGFSDLNEEFYSTEAAGLLIAPAFGIGSELAATGTNGPAIFPSTAATARLRAEPVRDGYVQFAAVNAEAGVLGDEGGISPLLRQGALLIAEAGIVRPGKFAAGAWTYTRRQEDIRATLPDGSPATSRARGAFVLAEVPLVPGRLDAFVRAGMSDGDTTPYSGGWQAGLLASAVVPGRPQSQVSLGIHQARLSAKYRTNAAEAGESLRRAETGAELTYSDALAPWLTVQPDVQYVWNAARGPAGRDALVLTLRLRAGFSRP